MSDESRTRPAILTRDLSVGYGSRAVLNDLNLQVRSGQVVAILGRNGAGKTTTLMTLAGLLPVIKGHVQLSSSPALGPLHVRARGGLAYISEERSIIRRLTVLDNLRLANVDPTSVFSIFPELAPLRKREAGLLSGGEQQMLALGRCLASSASVFLIDELSLGLAPLAVNRLLVAVRAAADAGRAVLLVEQKPSLALSISDEGYVLSQGRVAFHDSANELLRRLPEIERSYLSIGELSDMEALS